jgi:hypothetical protein
MYDVGHEGSRAVVFIKINVETQRTKEKAKFTTTKVGPIFFDMSDPDLFDNIDKFLKDNAYVY